MIALGDFSAYAMSHDASTIVGRGYYNGASRVIIWDEANGLRGLQPLLEVDLGLDLGRWKLEAATDISADGTVIVGRGTNPLGRPEGWVAVIPEPSTLVYLGLFGLLAARRRRRTEPRQSWSGQAARGGCNDPCRDRSLPLAALIGGGVAG